MSSPTPAGFGDDTTIENAVRRWQRSWQKSRFSARAVYQAIDTLERICCLEGKQTWEATIADLGLGSLQKLKRRQGRGDGPKTEEVVTAFLVENHLHLGDGWPEQCVLQEEGG